MEIRWSPRKRIRLDKHKGSSVSVESVDKVSDLPSAASSNSDNSQSSSGKRISADFDKELDECLGTSDNAFNPTQVFLVDPEMELAMLKVDMELQSSMSTPHESCKSTQSRPLSRWDTAPLFDSTTTNPMFIPPVKRHISEPFFPHPTTQQTVLVDELDGIDIAELSAIADGAQHAYVLQPLLSTQDSTSKQPEDLFYSRCRVLDIEFLKDSRSVSVGVFDEKNLDLTRIFLHGVWAESLIADPWQLQIDDCIELLKIRDKNISHYGDSTELFPDIVVFHPEIFISSTTLSGSANCHRKSVLQNRIVQPQVGPIPTDPDEITRAIAPIIGNCVHEALQAATVANDFTPNFIREAGARSLNELMLPAVWLSGASPQMVLTQLESRLCSMSSWGEKTWPKIASKLLGCETDVKALGVSGKLDMDIEDTRGYRSCIEIKTGKQSSIHVGQIVLYYLLQKKIEKSPVSEKMFLLYLPPAGPAETIEHVISARECQNIMRNRNLLASHNTRGSTLPPVVESRECTFCPVREECAILATNNQKGPVYDYMNKWLKHVDTLTDGLSATRRMRGNIFALVQENGEKIQAFSALKFTSFGEFSSFSKQFQIHALNTNKDSVVGMIVSLVNKKKRIILCGGESIMDEILEKFDEKTQKKICRIPSKSSDSLPIDLPDNWALNAETFESNTSLFVLPSMKSIEHAVLSKGNFDLAIVLDAHTVKDPYLWPVALRANQMILYGDEENEDDMESLFNRIRIGHQDTQGP